MGNMLLGNISNKNNALTQGHGAMLNAYNNNNNNNNQHTMCGGCLRRAAVIAMLSLSFDEVSGSASCQVGITCIMQATLSATLTTTIMSAGATAAGGTATTITAQHCSGTTTSATESDKMQIVSNAEVICRHKRKRTGYTQCNNMFAIGDVHNATNNISTNQMHVNAVDKHAENNNNQNNDMNPSCSPTDDILQRQHLEVCCTPPNQRGCLRTSDIMTPMSLCPAIRRKITKITSLPRMLSIAVMMVFLASCDLTQAALSPVNLFISPPAVRRLQTATLHCQYTLDGAPLYSVKFYRGQLEFFRVTPGEYPTTKVLHYAGINVDESSSNASQVVIRNADFGLSGNFSCEVTADAPLYSSATGYAQMQVVEFPDKRPLLFTELTRYEAGDVLRANCSTPPSRPRAQLRFTINNVPVTTDETQYIRTPDNLIASRLSLKLQLQSVHFAANTNSHLINALGAHGDPNGVAGSALTYSTLNANGGSGSGGGVATGGLLLRCTAQIGDLYQDYKEIELGAPQRDPVPARVTLSSGSGFKHFFETYFSSTSAAGTIDMKRTMVPLIFSLSVCILRHFQCE